MTTLTTKERFLLLTAVFTRIQQVDRLIKVIDKPEVVRFYELEKQELIRMESRLTDEAYV